MDFVTIQPVHIQLNLGCALVTRQCQPTTRQYICLNIKGVCYQKTFTVSLSVIVEWLSFEQCKLPKGKLIKNKWKNLDKLYAAEAYSRFPFTKNTLDGICKVKDV